MDETKRTISVTISLPIDEVERLRREADENNRSLSGEIGYQLKHFGSSLPCSALLNDIKEIKEALNDKI